MKTKIENLKLNYICADTDAERDAIMKELGELHARIPLLSLQDWKNWGARVKPDSKS